MIQHILKIVWKNKSQNALLLIEIFVSFIILSAIFIYLIRDIGLIRTPLGFDTKDKLMILLYDNRNQDSIAFIQKIQNLQRELKSQPEIIDISFGNSIYPFSNSVWSSVSEVNNIQVWYLQAGMDENYQNTMNIPMVDGKWLEKPIDESSDIKQIVVNEAFINKNFNGKTMVDSVLNLNGDKKIVGVMKNYKYNGQFTEEEPIIIEYLNPYNKNNLTCVFLNVKENTPSIFEEKISKIVFQSTGINNFVIKNLDENRISQSKLNWISLTLLITLGIFIIFNVAMGLFGVLWYNINKRRYEISLRKAMGATNISILGQFVFELLGLSFIAILLGSLLIAQIAYFELIKDLSPVLIYKGLLSAVVFVLALVISCAIYPSWRAAQFHPAEGLKDE
jgi:putative ABC transport system permease protein